MSKQKLIKPLESFSNVSDADVLKRVNAILTDMTGNAQFPTPPVDMAMFKTQVEALAHLVTEALDGSKKVIAQKNKQREAVIKMVLGRYVEVTSSGDMAIFQTSGFQPASTARTTSEPLLEKIRKIDLLSKTMVRVEKFW